MGLATYEYDEQFPVKEAALTLNELLEKLRNCYEKWSIIRRDINV
jgi:hypothetical protein